MTIPASLGPEIIVLYPHPTPSGRKCQISNIGGAEQEGPGDTGGDFWPQICVIIPRWPLPSGLYQVQPAFKEPQTDEVRTSHQGEGPRPETSLATPMAVQSPQLSSPHWAPCRASLALTIWTGPQAPNSAPRCCEMIFFHPESIRRPDNL